MTTERRENGEWWVIDPTGILDDMGPYRTKADAESDRRGVERFNRFENRPGFVTVDDRRPITPN
ncbi:hypothetical protein LCGC14_1577440 [marine sediment metagenome]|uniref:Uncharacterized protein n=1 Tax=marine sediment metagenome TaxID=412755 RepID=A0A0F9LI24_9ZZZZ